jgi:hypothetical protein
MWTLVVHLLILLLAGPTSVDYLLMILLIGPANNDQTLPSSINGLISHYATGEVDARIFSQRSGYPYALTLL